MNHVFAANGTSPEFTLDAGYHNLVANGTFGSGTAKLQHKVTETLFVDMPSASFTTNTVVVQAHGAGRYRWSLTGATNPALTVSVSD